MKKFYATYKRKQLTEYLPIFMNIEAENEYEAIKQALNRVSEADKDSFRNFEIKRKGE